MVSETPKGANIRTVLMIQVSTILVLVMLKLTLNNNDDDDYHNNDCDECDD